MFNFEEVSAVMWSLTAFCILLTIGRYTIRYRARHRFYSDDIFHLSALIFLIVSNALVEAMFPPARIMFDGPPGIKPPSSTVTKFRKLQTAMNITFFVSQFSVKFSFLFFYKELFWVSQRFMRAWWCVGTFVFLGFWAVLAGNLTQCGGVRDIVNPAACAKHKQYQHDARIYICTINLTTDITIVILPMFMLRKLHIRLSQKLGLALIFSVGAVTIVMEVIRVQWAIKGGLIANNAFWGIMSACFAVMVSCIPTYRSLLGVQRHGKGDQYAVWGMSEESAKIGADASKLMGTKGGSSGAGSTKSKSKESIGQTEGKAPYEMIVLPAFPDER